LRYELPSKGVPENRGASLDLHVTTLTLTLQPYPNPTDPNYT